MHTGQESGLLIEQRVLDFVRTHNQILPHTRLVVAVSGGQDSVCLLHALVRLRKELQIELHIAHLDHRLRGAESRGDARYVAGLARRFGIPATIEKRDVRAYHSERDVTLEEAAREVRYAFLTGVAQSIGAERVAVGHTTDDHVETVLMHIIRGAGTTGLRGLQPVTRWQSDKDGIMVIRPLLAVTREETGEYCRRFRMRPHIAEAMVRTARIVADDLVILERETARLWEAVVRRQEDTIVIEKAGFAELPVGLQRNLLRRGLEELLGNLMDWAISWISRRAISRRWWHS